MKTFTKILTAVGALVLTASAAHEADACTRVVYRGADNLYVVARSLDWKTPIPTNIYVYPRGIPKQSSNLPNHLKWTSKYGAVYAVIYDGGVTEGMNEKGLVVNGLFCKGTVYNDSVSSKPYVMSLAVFPAWLLDQCAYVQEVRKMLEDPGFEIQGATFDGGTVSALHWGVTDASGESIIFEFDHGKINIHDMGDVRAMTNDPQWPAMTAIINYWDKVGGRNFLPGTVSSPDRCVRANYFAHHVEAVPEADTGVTIARSILVNCSVPYTYLIQGDPNVSSTQWRTYSDVRDVRYYFELVTNPGYYYIDLRTLDLSRTPALDYARDMFMMSFCLRGMSFIDMAFLKKTDLKDGYVTYRRRKTGQLLVIEWTREMQRILDKYPANESCYLLPVIRRTGTNERSVYRNAAYSINRSLKRVAPMAGVTIPLTLYVARHSWASAAKAKGIPVSVISEGMGHDSEATTQIYLAALDTSAVDRANTIILKSLR